MELATLIVGAVANGLVTWGVVSTKLAWMRADLERHEKRLDALEARA
ncbi:MAG: hypothetical protein ACTHL8_09945 [Burkholderiaceae bacterium]